MTIRFQVVVIFLCFAAAAGCSKKVRKPAGSLSAQQTSALVSQLVGAPIPEGATDVHGTKVSVFTTCVNVRFSCSKAQLQTFLKASPRLPDMLDPSEKSLVQIQDDMPWWKPDSLTNTEGLKTEWKDGTDIVSCNILAGKESDENQTVVYLLFVLESKKGM